MGLVLGALGIAGVGCSFDPDGNPSPQCRDGEVCADGLVCYRGFCVSDTEPCTDMETSACYDGAEGTQGVGVCRAGERACVGSTWSACLGQRIPVAETCNGEDDDCDGAVDEIDGDLSCDTGLAGVCATGELRCQGAFAVCVRLEERGPEVCDGDDDDCDDRVDEGTEEAFYPDATAGCALVDGVFDCEGICVAGQRLCQGGMLADCTDAVTPRPGIDACTDTTMTPVAEDDDCDGDVDEDCVCINGSTQSCYGGPMGTDGVGVCMRGTQTCVNNSFGPCVGSIEPSEETCSNLGADDDCDGTLDNIADLGTVCIDAGAMGICREGNFACEVGMPALVCRTPMPQTETCNDLDDNCDGEVDDGFDKLTDENNCGDCGNTCSTGQECCAGGCRDTDTDEQHCGACGNACGVGLTCCGGDCVDTATTETSCGMCGNTCEAGRECCDSSCSNTQTDPLHCGMCGNACNAGENCCGGTCSTVSCACAACMAGGGTCCGDMCIDTQTDEANCGMCGNMCGATEECSSGLCCAVGTVNCGGVCVDTTSDAANCGMCGMGCGVGETCCDSTCVDTAIDEGNCGGCGVPCANTCCGSSCVDTSADLANCGGCGMPCAGTCTAGTCCPPGTELCDGACVDTSTSLLHCGMCTNPCAGTCMSGVCCAAGTELCGGACVDTETDLTHCGMCNNACGGMTPACCAGTCQASCT
ncbi:MAG: hypothetical protein AAGF12_12265 [Myxococcota bacterium]